MSCRTSPPSLNNESSVVKRCPLNTKSQPLRLGSVEAELLAHQMVLISDIIIDASLCQLRLTTIMYSQSRAPFLIGILVKFKLQCTLASYVALEPCGVVLHIYGIRIFLDARDVSHTLRLPRKLESRCDTTVVLVRMILSTQQLTRFAYSC